MLRLGYFFVFAIVSALLAALNVRAYRWVREAFSPSPRAQRLLVAGLVASWSLTAVGRFAGRSFPELPIVAPLAVGLTVQLTVIVGVGFLLLLDIWRSGRRVVCWAASRSAAAEPSALAVPSAQTPPAASPELGRRAFTTQVLVGSAFVASGGCSLYGVLKGRHDYTIEEVPIHLPGLSPKLDGFSIVQLSDLHIGTFVGEPELSAAIDLIRQAKPDLIVLTGDLIDNDVRRAPVLGRFVRRMEGLAREGVAVISGNHDYYAGIEETLGAVHRGGASLLRNRGRIIGDPGAGFALLGVDDVRGARFERGGGPHLRRALASLPKHGGRVSPALDLPRVLLCHNPAYFEKAASKVGLQLSGHTHGGQFNPGVRPADWVFRHGWVSGRYESAGAQLYVNRGFGTAGPPVRLGSPPEVTRIVLTARA